MPSQAVAIRYRDLILKDLQDGKFVRDIADELNVTIPAISQYLANDPEYVAARESGAERRLAEQYRALEGAAEPLSLARARETFRAASWFAEREFPHRWGQKSEVTHRDGDLGDALRRAQERRGRLIEHEPQAMSVAAPPQIEPDRGG